MIPRANSKDSFIHPLLDLTCRQVRLLRILRSSTRSRIVRCEMKVTDLVEDTYVALSYVWGTDDPAHQVLINGNSLLIRRNLLDFLVSEASSTRDVWLWIDAICINQNDVKEKNHQVRQMLDVYRSAKYVLTWLGSATNSAISSVMAFDANPVAGDGEQSNQPDSIKQLISSGLLEISKNSYWSRLWIVPEVLSAKSLRLRCGGQEFDSWRHLSTVIRNFIDTDDFVVTKLTQRQQPDDVHAKTIAAVQQSIMWDFYLQRLHEKNAEQGFIDLLESYGSNRCKDERDRVFALLPLSAQSNRSIIDYGMSTEQLFCHLTQNRSRYLYDANLDVNQAPRTTSGQKFTLTVMRVLNLGPTRDGVFKDKHDVGCVLNFRRLELNYRPSAFSQDVLRVNHEGMHCSFRHFKMIVEDILTHAESLSSFCSLTGLFYSMLCIAESPSSIKDQYSTVWSIFEQLMQKAPPIQLRVCWSCWMFANVHIDSYWDQKHEAYEQHDHTLLARNREWWAEKLADRESSMKDLERTLLKSGQIVNHSPSCTHELSSV